MAALLHVCADGAAPRVVEHEAVTGIRSYERVADYAYAAPGGLRWLTIHDLSRPIPDLDALATADAQVGAVGVGGPRSGDLRSGPLQVPVGPPRGPGPGHAPEGRRPAGDAPEDDPPQAGTRPVRGSAGGAPPGGGSGNRVSLTVFEQISPVEGWLTAEGVVAGGELPAGEAVLSVTMDVEEGALDLFHGWYDEEHLPKLVAVPGIDAARRFRAVAGDVAEPGRRRFLALYELAGLDFLETPAWAAAASMTPRTAEVVPHVVMNSQLYRR